MSNRKFILRDYQTDIVTRVFDAWRSHRSVMVQMPTGTGKTHVLATVIKRLMTDVEAKGEERGVPLFREKSDTRVWIVAHRRELVAQIEETIKRHGLSCEGDEIKVMSIQWLMRHWDDVSVKPSLIVIDEAHHALADSYKDLWRRFPDAWKLGMTATPCRMNRCGFTDLFDVLLTSWSISEFIKRGYLAPFDYMSIRAYSDEQQLINSLQKRGADGDYQLKELNNVLNRRQSIERLYASMDKFAHNKKGIVYAIGIDHARSIAEYYCAHGVSAIVIDSKTPAEKRRHMVDCFKAGVIKVMINVDVFSEGFDCPDVEFIQLARPTLSLAKYLQQVGRGLRVSDKKEACIIIDNVGLYRVFGLPVVAWDWDAMFRGAIAGKGHNVLRSADESCLSEWHDDETVVHDEMEMVVSHDMLLEMLCGNSFINRPLAKKLSGLKAWQDESGLWGLRRGRITTAKACYLAVLDIKDDVAAVMFDYMSCGVVDASGRIIVDKIPCRSLKFKRNKILDVVYKDGSECFIDLCSLRMYDRKPEIRRFGDIELLKIGNIYYSRTKQVYVSNVCRGKDFIAWHKFYLTIFDYKMPSSCFTLNNDVVGFKCGYACVLYGDTDTYYWLYCRLADDSIIVKDTHGRYYHVEDKKEKAYIGVDVSDTERQHCMAEIERLTRLADKKAIEHNEKISIRRQRILNNAGEAKPFKAGLKWGLKVGDRITVPPVYRNVRPPIGKYCAVEKSYSRWGVVAIDGRVLINPEYPKVSIADNGTALLTSVSGKTISVKL